MTPIVRLGLVLVWLGPVIASIVLVLHDIVETMTFSPFLLLFLLMWEPSSVPHFEAHWTRQSFEVALVRGMETRKLSKGRMMGLPCLYHPKTLIE